MKKQEKQQVVAELSEQFKGSNAFYLTDTSALSVEQINKVRRKCFEKNVQLRVAKNTLIKIALDSLGGNYDGIDAALKGPTSVMFTDTPNLPAKLIKELHKEFGKPVLKAAIIDQDVFVGEGNLDMLAALKSREELIGDVISALQSPAINVISGLKSGGNKIAGILETLGNKSE